MVQVRKRVLIALYLLAALPAAARKFYPDDPIQVWPKPVPVDRISEHDIDLLYDFAYQSFVRKTPKETPARAVNTLGEAPDSAWYTNRHARRRMTLDQLRRGPGDSNPPRAPFTVVGAKTEGITPGFRMTDAAGRLYIVKPDPFSNPEMATAADVIGSKFFHALGYFTPENYILNLQRKQLKVAPEARISGKGHRKRALLERDLDDFLRVLRPRPDGAYRLLASLVVSGEPLGPFHFEGVRNEDPNDTIPHEDRRDLRGLFVFCAWLNHTDAKGKNSQDSLVEENGVKFVRHHLIDFGAILGSDSDMVKNARFGHHFIIPRGREALKDMLSLGLRVHAWEGADYPGLPAVGRFEADVFDPDAWHTNYPNPAFRERRPDDEFWAAKQVMAFTDAEIRALVETGQYSDPAVVDYLTRTLGKRRDKIGRAFFAKLLPLDQFRLEGGELKFADLAVRHGFARQRQYRVSWSRFDNEKDTHAELPGAAGFRLPAEVAQAPPGRYFAARIRAAGEDGRTVTVFLRTVSGSPVVVGIERTW